METIIEFAQFEFSAVDREHFRNGILWRQWIELYSQLFDEDDLRLFKSQANMPNAGYKFFESFAAVMLFEEYGYLSLLEKYATKSKHKRKKQIIHLLSDPLLDAAIEMLKDRFGGHGPDLLVYTPDHKEWFFVEVKSPSDSLKPEQKEKFIKLAELTNKPIYLVRLVPS